MFSCSNWSKCSVGTRLLAMEGFDAIRPYNCFISMPISVESLFSRHSTDTLNELWKVVPQYCYVFITILTLIMSWQKPYRHVNAENSYTDLCNDIILLSE